MNGVLLGAGMAALGALSWAAHYLCVRLGMEDQPLGDVVLLAVVVQAVVVVPVALVVHGGSLGLTPTTLALFTAAGLASGLFGRVCQYVSTRRIGASKTSPVVASAGLVSAALAVAILNESVTPVRLLGILLVVAGVSVTSLETAAEASGGTRREAGLMMLAPVGAAVFYGVEPVFVKLGLRRGTPALVGLAVMAVAAAVAFLGYRWAQGKRGLSVPTGGAGFRWSVAAGVVGAVAYLAYLGALSVAPVVVVLPVFQTTPLLVAALSFVFLTRRLEAVTWRLGAAAAMVVAGASLVSLAG